MNDIHVRLYVAANTVHSARAVTRLADIAKRHAHLRWNIEVIDVFNKPAHAIEDGILVTPSLVKVSPEPRRIVIGDLSDEGAVCLALGLEPA